MSWNGYPSYVCNVILRKVKERKKNTNGHCSDSEDDDTLKIWFRVPYIGPIGEKFAKKENEFRNFENVPRKNLNLFLCMIQRKLRSFSLTRTLYLLIYNHTSYINLNVPDVRQNILGKRTDVLIKVKRTFGLQNFSSWQTST